MMEDVRAFEAMLQHKRFIGQQFIRFTISDDLAVIEHDDSRTEQDDQFEIVRGHELGDGETLQNSNQFATAAGIEIAGGFIQHKQFGIAGKNSSQTDAAFFAAAEAVRSSLFKAAEADHFERLGNFRSNLIGVQTELAWTESDILPNRRAKELIVGILKKQADIGTNLRKIIDGCRPAKHLYRGILIRPLGEQAVQMQQECGFPGAVCSDECYAFAFRKRKG